MVLWRWRGSLPPGPLPPTRRRAITASRTSSRDRAVDSLIASVSPALAARGWYTEAGGGAESRTLERLARRLRAGGSPWGLVALRQPPAGGTRFFAEDVLDELRADAERHHHGRRPHAQRHRRGQPDLCGRGAGPGLVEAIPEFQRDVTAGYERLFELLAGAPLTDELAPLDPSAGTAPGRSTVPLFVAGGALLGRVAAAVLVVVSSAPRRSGLRRGASIARYRQLLGPRLRPAGGSPRIRPVPERLQPSCAPPSSRRRSVPAERRLPGARNRWCRHRQRDPRHQRGRRARPELPALLAVGHHRPGPARRARRAQAGAAPDPGAPWTTWACGPRPPTASRPRSSARRWATTTPTATAPSTRRWSAWASRSRCGVPLVDPHGNFGSLDDPPAAPRYTECRLAEAAVDAAGRARRGHRRVPPHLRRGGPRAGLPPGPAARTCWSTAAPASPSAWRRTCRPTTWCEVCQVLRAGARRQAAAPHRGAAHGAAPARTSRPAASSSTTAPCATAYGTGRGTIRVRARAEVGQVSRAPPGHRGHRAALQRRARSGSSAASASWSAPGSSGRSPT